MKLKNKFSVFILVAFVFVYFFNLNNIANAVTPDASGKLSDTAIVNEEEPGLMIDTGGPSFIRGDKFEGEIDPNFLPPKELSGANRSNMAIKDVTFAGVMLALVFTMTYFIYKKHNQGKIAHGISIFILILMIIALVFFIYAKIANAWDPLSSTSCAVNGNTYSNWEALTSAVASSGYCTGGSGYVTGGSENRPSSYSWKCTGWQNGTYVVTASCSVSASGGSSGGGSTAPNCNN